MEYYILPLQELLCAVPPKSREPRDLNFGIMITDACKLQGAPANTDAKVTAAEVSKIKDYLQDLDPNLMVPRTAEQFMEAGLPPAELSLRSQAAAGYLKSMLPPSEFELTPTGLRRVIEPSKTEDIKFLWKCRVMENPWYIMNLFSTRMLTGADMECLQAVYPQEYDMMSAGLLAYVMDKFSTDSAIPRNLRLMLAIFFGQPTIKLEQLAAYEKGNDKAEAAASPPAQSQSTPSNLAAQEAPRAAQALRG